MNLKSLFTFFQEALGEDYNLERIIDDFVLLTFLVGNDFIPHLPDFHIHAGSLPTLWQTYKEVRPNLDGRDFLSISLMSVFGLEDMKHLNRHLTI